MCIYRARKKRRCRLQTRKQSNFRVVFIVLLYSGCLSEGSVLRIQGCHFTASFKIHIWWTKLLSAKWYRGIRCYNTRLKSSSFPQAEAAVARGRASVSLSEGCWLVSPGLHVNLSMGKILNPKLLLMCWSAPCTVATTISVSMSVSIIVFGQKRLLNALNAQKDVSCVWHIGTTACKLQLCKHVL